MKIVLKLLNNIRRCLNRENKFEGAIVYNNGENIKLGKNVSFGGRVILFGTADIEIGDNTMIATNVVIHTSTHDYSLDPVWQKRIDRPVIIGKNVWIGIGAIIMPGVKVGNNSVIGAGSVVVAHVPENAIVAGNPARIISYKKDNLLRLDNIEYPGIYEKKGFLDDKKVCKEK